MPKIISIHSFRGGTGKSNTTANLASLLAADALRVGVVDTDLNSPGVHVPFGLDLEDPNLKYTLNDYLWGKCNIEEAAHDVTTNLHRSVEGQIFLVPASIKAGEITRLLRDGYDVGLLNDGFDDLIDALSLDLLLVDTHPGLSNETLLSLAITDILVILLRPDHQDYQGTAVTVEVARKLDVPDMMLVINKMPQVYDFGEVKARVEQLYRCDVAAIIPHSEEMMSLGSQGIFALRYPHNEVTRALKQLSKRITG
jgi:MinD-like ATPase involved in chromosome partitioning or flagellar assembly